MRVWIQWGYLPGILALGYGSAIYVVNAGLPSWWLVLLVLALITISFLAETISPYEAEFNKAKNDTIRDTIHAVVNESLNLIGLMVLPFFSGFFTIANWWPHDWPLLIQLLAAILIADVGITLVHFASHHIPFLWRFHAVHHSVKRMYGFNGLMKHPIHQIIETIAGITPLLLIGVSHEVLTLLAIAVIIQLLLQHSNVSYFCKPLHYILALNVSHRIHHLNSKEGNVNFGLFTMLTDSALGTIKADMKHRITSGNIGINSEPNYPISYFSQIKQPFRKQKT